jgi:DNA polymerase I-like protein with 3'-5' exonuclease and polymerase domains
MKRIALDLETTMDHKTIHVCKTLDIDSGELKTWKAAKPLEEYLRDATLITAHNGIGFDFKVLMKLWSIKIPLSQQCDTLILSRLLEPSRENGHSLESWGERLGTKKTPYSKLWCWMMDRKEEYSGECFDRPIMPLLEYYCEGDVIVLRELFLHLESEVKTLGFSDQSVELEHQVASICKEMEENGFKLDTTAATVHVATWQGKLSTIIDRAQELYPPVVYERYSDKTGKRLKDGVRTFNIGSRQQIAEKLIELGWKPGKHTEKGNIIVDEAVLDEIIKECS